MQLILVLETRPSCNSDYRYIKATIDYFYKPRSFSVKPIYAKSKGELVKQDAKIEEEIKRYDGESKVVVDDSGFTLWVSMASPLNTESLFIAFGLAT